MSKERSAGTEWYKDLLESTWKVCVATGVVFVSLAAVNPGFTSLAATFLLSGAAAYGLSKKQ